MTRLLNNRENFRAIDGYDNYEVSDCGRVRNVTTARILKAGTRNGYQQVGLSKVGKIKTMKIHQLVAQAFLENPLNKKCIDHIDNNKLNNHVSNLRYATPRENGMNKTKSKNTSSSFKGVYFFKRDKKWYARIKINGKTIHLGSFKTEKLAAIAYNNAAILNFKEFAKLNVIV
jgi:hypothetical protein